ncbi:MAG: carboxypeptidase regulatory-like domain-containing protein, partial [Edaphobacter sp.]
MSKLTMRLLKWGFFCALLGWGFAGLGYGQGLGTLVGTVTDSSGAVVPSAAVKATGVDNGLHRSAITNAQGYFVIPSLQPSQYQLEVGAPGFQNFIQKNITLQADNVLTVNAVLQIGTAQQTVTVTGAPPQVDTTTSTLSEVVNHERMVDMPLNGRNAANLALLTAGTVATPSQAVDQGVTKTAPGAVTISTNGSRQSQISWNLDGGNNQDILTNINQPFPFPDALQEFSVQTSNYSARYGGNSGGVVNVITRSGTNQFHGGAFEFLRNAAFDARNYFASRVDQLKRNQFGGTIGGPIKKDRTFFFAGYQRTIVHNTSTKAATVPTEANEGLGTAYPGAGDFTALLDASSPNNPNPGKVTKIINPA